MATQPCFCLLDIQAWTIHAHSLALGSNNSLIFFQFSVPNEPRGNTSSSLNSPAQTWTSLLGPVSPSQLHCPLPSSFLKGPPKSPTPSHSAPENSQDIHECDSHVPQVGDGVSMKEGPEALVGGPPLSLSVGPALSAFRLWLPGRDTTPDPLEDMLFSHFVHWQLSHPHLPSKGLSAAAQPTWYFFSGGFLAWVVGPGDGHREGGGRGKINKVHRACFGACDLASI